MAGKAASSSNPLVVTGTAPDASLHVDLHPLVLLTISDYITRHAVRQQQGAIVGAIIGQQNGRSFTLEHAFECKLADDSSDVRLDAEWFSERLDQYKEVHKAASLDLVALFLLGPVNGPQPEHLPVVQQVRDMVNTDNLMLLLFHPELVDSLSGGKLPITLYESFEEVESDQLQLRFRELQFEVETGDAEMIGVNSVATSGGSATAVPKAETTASAGASKAAKDEKKTKGKGKAKEKSTEENEVNGSTNILSAEDDELITTLNSKVNAIKMLNERINLIRSYLETLPQSYLTNATSTNVAPEGTNFTLLRSVNSMLSRLPLLAPPNSSSLESTQTSSLRQAGEKAKEDVHLTNLLASLTRSVAEAQNLGSKFSILQREKQAKERTPFGGRGGGRMGFMGGDEGLLADNGGF